jgi:Trypsin
MRRVVLVLATMALAIVLAGGVAQAIINGEPDRGPNAHPYVGMVYNDESLCSGTVISPRIFLTAAHCTDVFEQGDSKVFVTFEQRADFKPDNAYVGIPHTHPRDNGFFPDVGVVVLEKPVRMATYGTLPEAVWSTPSRWANTSPPWATVREDSTSAANRRCSHSLSSLSAATERRLDSSRPNPPSATC